MKNFYLLLSAACVAVSASAVDKDMVVKSNPLVNVQWQKALAKPAKDVKKVLKRVESSPESTRAGEMDYAYFRGAQNLMSIGLSTNGFGGDVIGFKPVQGDFVFNNYSTNVKSNVWNYAWYENKQPVSFSSTDTDLVIESRIAQMVPPVLSIEYNSGASAEYSLPATDYLVGASTDYWGLGEDSQGGIFGLSFYQNSGYMPDGKHAGSSSYSSTYNVSPSAVASGQYSAGGVYIDAVNDDGAWAKELEEYYESPVSDLVLDNFTVIQPKPLSPYAFTVGWIWANVTATADTQLLSYVYPVDEEGTISDTPIAIGYAAIARGETNVPYFEYYPLNEDGDETEGLIIIDSEVAVTFEGFQGNSAIVEFSPVSGFYPFNYNAYIGGNYDVISPSTLYVQITANVGGETKTAILRDRGLYVAGPKDIPAEEMLSSLTYAQFSVDAVYAYVQTADGNDTFNVALEGGDVKVDFDALYYMTTDALEAGLYEITCPDWITYEFLEPNRETGLSSIKFTVAAATEGRTGEVSINSLGVVCNLKFVQGEGGDAVEVVTADGKVQYYDLTGRRVVNPEKGVYVKVTGNKSEKVVF